MQRLEPTVRELELSGVPEAGARHVARRRAHARRSALVRSLAVIFFSLLLPAGLIVYATVVGAFGGIERPVDFEQVAKLLIIWGFFVVIASQLVAFALICTRSLAHAVLSFLVPGYLLFAATRTGLYWSIVTPWLVGGFAIVFGTVALS